MKSGSLPKIIIALAITLIATMTGGRADAATDLWATSAGGSGNEDGYAIASAPDGSAIVAGAYSGSVAFGSTTLTSTGSRDVFVAKIDPAGQWSWAVSAGTSGQGDVARAVSVLPDGSALVTGYFRGTMSFPGSTVPNLVSVAQEDVFVAKVSSAGQWQWATKGGSSSGGGSQGPDVGRGIAALSDGSAIVTGYFQGSANFGSSNLVSAGSRDAFIAKIDASGAWQWAVAAGSTYEDEGFGVAAYADDTVVVTGNFASSIAFGTLGTMTTTGEGAFVARVDSAGNWLWQNSAVGPDPVQGLAVSTQPDGAVGVTGSFNATATFGSTGSITASGADDIFVAELDAAGQWVWVTAVGDTLSDSGVAIAATGDGNFVLAGSFQGAATFGTFGLTSNGVEDAFIAELDRSGTFIWAQRGGGLSFEENRGVTELPDGSFMVVGDFEGTAVFGGDALVSNGVADLFVARYADVPRAPYAVSVLREAGQLVISWSPPTIDGGAPVESYTVEVQPGGASCTVQHPVTTCTLPDADPLAALTVTATATNAAGTGSASEVVPVLPLVPARYAG